MIVGQWAREAMQKGRRSLASPPSLSFLLLAEPEVAFVLASFSTVFCCVTSSGKDAGVCVDASGA